MESELATFLYAGGAFGSPRGNPYQGDRVVGQFGQQSGQSRPKRGRELGRAELGGDVGWFHERSGGSEDAHTRFCAMSLTSEKGMNFRFSILQPQPDAAKARL